MVSLSKSRKKEPKQQTVCDSKGKIRLRELIKEKTMNSLLKPSYSSSLTGEISRPSYWWLLDDVSADAFASVAGCVPIGMLTPVIPVRGLCACLIWPREYIPCIKWVPLGVDKRRCGVSFCNKKRKRWTWRSHY